MPMQPGDVPVTFANVDDLVEDMILLDTSIEEGIAKFVGWYRQVYQVGDMFWPASLISSSA